MSLLRNIARGLRILFRKEQMEDEMDEELRGYLDESAKDKTRSGISPEEAVRTARVEMGSMETVKEGIRSAGWEYAVETVWQDVRYALRRLRRSPGFTVTTILTLTLAIGANTAIFSLAYALLLRRLPVDRPDRLVQVELNLRQIKGQGEVFPSAYLSGGFFDAISEQQRVFSGLCAWTNPRVNLSDKEGTHPIWAAEITGDCFRTLGLRPILGRLFTADEDRHGGGPHGYPVVLSYAYWTAHLNADPAVLGRSLDFEGKPGVVVGVLAPGFQSVMPDDVPLMYLPSEFGDPGDRHHFGSFNRLIFARLRDGVSIDQAAAQLDSAYNNWIDANHPEWRASKFAGNSQEQHVFLQPARTGYSYLRTTYRKPLLILEILVGLSLLIACAYLAIMFSARALMRRHELAVCAALGAARGRIVRQLASEALVVALAGTAFGILFALGASRLLLSLMFSFGKQVELDLSPNLWVLLFTTGICLFTLLLFGLAPALRASHLNPATDIKEGGQSLLGSLSRRRLGIWIVPAQIAFSLVLVVAAAMFSSSLVRLLSQDRGFRTTGTLFFNTDFSRHTNGKMSVNLNPLLSDLLDRLNHAPGIQSASLSQTHPLLGAMYINSVSTTLPSGELRKDDLVALNVAPRYLETMGTRLIAGREFTTEDREGSPLVCVLSQTAASYFFPGGKAVGQFLNDAGDKQPRQVIGIAQDTKYKDLSEDPRRMIYVPVLQRGLWNFYIDFAVNATDPAMASASLHSIFKDLAPDVVLYDPVTMRQMVNGSLSQQRLLVTLSNFFALLALFLTGIGVYGLLNYSVLWRRPEIGLRMALGASRGSIVQLVLKQAMWLVLPGLALGIAGAAAMTRLLKSLLYGTKPLDPAAFAISIAAFLVIAALACALPARRAAAIDPMQALRAE